MTTTPTPEEQGIAARAASAQVRAALGRIRQSIEGIEDRARSISDPRRRELLMRCASAILAAYQTRAAADKIKRTATNTPFLIITEQETTSIMSTVKAHIDRLTPAYLGLSPIQTALAIGEIMEMATAKPKSTAALRGVAARAQFDAARRGVRPKSDEEDQSNDQLCPTCGRPLDPTGDEPEPGSDGKPKGLRRHKHTDARNLAVIKSAGADAPLTFTGLASSTAIDRMADRFSRASLITMSRAFPGTPIHVDHSFKMADLVGKTVSATLKKNDDGETDLWIVGELDKSNPKALSAWNAIKAGLPVSLSVGVIVLSQTKTSDTLRGQPVWSIDDVEPLEISLVSLPALARARVTAAKSAKERAAT